MAYSTHAYRIFFKFELNLSLTDSISNYIDLRKIITQNKRHKKLFLVEDLVGYTPREVNVTVECD